MLDRGGIFAGENPFEIARQWLQEAEETEINDPTAMALSTVDAHGLPNVRMVLLKDIEADAFVFYTNYGSQKAQEIKGSGKAAFVLHWKTLRRQIRVRGTVSRVEGAEADAYFQLRPLKSRIGAYASKQSQILAKKADLVTRVAKFTATLGLNPPRPAFWGGFRIRPVEIEFWGDGAFRLHDRFRWSLKADTDADITTAERWQIDRLNP